MSLTKFSKDIFYQTHNFSQKGTVANEHCIGLLADIPKAAFSHAVRVPYFVSSRDFDAIAEAIPERIVLMDTKLSYAVHAPLKFLSEFITMSIFRLNFSGKSIKIVGPKMNKREVTITAESVHYCFYQPADLDNFRKIESSEVMYRQLAECEAKIALTQDDCRILEKRFEKNPLSSYSDGLAQARLKVMTERKVAEREKLRLENIIDSLERQSVEQNVDACNVGTQFCDQKCDIVVSFDSFYDINLKDAFSNFRKNGAQTVYMSLIMPFALMFVENYVSSELNVRFERRGRGFIMTHATDMSNGYCHDNSTTVFELMQSSFVVEYDGNAWMAEIVDNRAEICLIKFVRAMKTSKIVRKLLPSKYDKMSFILDPLDYFGPYRYHTPMLVNTSKLNLVVAFVKRNKNSKTIVEDTFAFAQTTFMRVEVGSTILQEGGIYTEQEMNAITCYALIHGATDVNLVGNAYKAAKPVGWFRSVWNAMRDNIKRFLHQHFKTVYEFFTMERAHRYIKERFELSSLILESDINKRWSIVECLNQLNNIYENASNDFYNQMPTIYEMFKQAREPIDFIAKFGAIAFGEYDETFKVFRSVEYNRRLENKREALRLKPLQVESRGIKIEKEAEKRDAYNDEVLQIFEQAKKSSVLREFLDDDELNRNDELAEEDGCDELIEKFLKDVTVKKNQLQRIYDDEPGLTIDNEDMRIRVLNTLSVSKNESKTIDREHGVSFRTLPEHQKDLDLMNRDNVGERGMSPLSKAAFDFNSNRMKDGKLHRVLKDKEIARLMKKFSHDGEYVEMQFDYDSFCDDLEKLKSVYTTEEEMLPNGNLRKLKTEILELTKTVLKDGTLERKPTKKLLLINGMSGSGKTRNVGEKWDAQDAYLVAFSGVHASTRKYIKEKYKGQMDVFHIYTYEHLKSVPKSGNTLWIDECKALNRAMKRLIIMSTDYKRYVFIGDEEQTGAHDDTGLLNCDEFFADYDPDKIARWYYTFRFGPRVAAFLNYSFNYPVFSLCNFDTTLTFHDLTELSDDLPGLSIAISEDGIKNYVKMIPRLITAKASQGMDENRTNVILNDSDVISAVQFRSNGIVACSRVKEELHIYMDRQSKSTHASAKLLAFATNFNSLFGIMFSNIQDFSIQQ